MRWTPRHPDLHALLCPRAVHVGHWGALGPVHFSASTLPPSAWPALPRFSACEPETDNGENCRGRAATRPQVEGHFPSSSSVVLGGGMEKPGPLRLEGPREGREIGALFSFRIFFYSAHLLTLPAHPNPFFFFPPSSAFRVPSFLRARVVPSPPGFRVAEPAPVPSRAPQDAGARLSQAWAWWRKGC